MKKLLLSIIVLVAFVFTSFSQSKMVIPAAQYEIMKSQGKLQPGMNYLPVPDVHPDPTIARQELQSASTAKSSSAGCSCYVTPDGTYTLAMAPNDDGSTGLISIPFNFCLYGTSYNTLYINNNGNISFGTPYGTFSSFPFPDPGYVMVAPFWGDVDTRGTGTVKYKITPTAMFINWDHVGYYSQQTNLVNTFQLIITDGTDPVLPTGNNIAFCYQDMQWTTGGASCTNTTCSYGGNNYTCTPFCGVPSTVGVNQGGPGGNYIQMGRFDHPGIDYDGGYGSNDGISWLDNQSLYFNSCSSTNIAPIASGLNNCDTIRICGSGDTLILNGLFLAPEIGQNTTIAVNLNGTPNTSIVSNISGNAADAVVMIIATLANAGNNVITFTATDNGNPVGTTVVNVNIFVDTTGISNFNPIISGNHSFCYGSTDLLSVTPTTYDTYVWSTGAFGTSINADTSGIYWLTASLNGCYKSTSFNVVEHHPTPEISGYPFTCQGGVTSLYSDSLIYTSYLWTGGTTNDSLMAGNGTYTLTIIDSFGCTATSPPVTVTGPIPPVITGITAVCNGSLASLWTTLPYQSYIWSDPGNANLSTSDTVHVPASGPYTVNVIDINGCTLTSLPFTVSPFNYALSVAGIPPFCVGQTINLTASTNNVTLTPGYLWSTNATTPSININSGGTYTVTLTYPNGCTADSAFTVAPPNPIPTPIIQGSLFTCNSTPTTLTVSGSYPTYSWSNSSSNSSISVLSGNYTVTVTDANGCVGNSPLVTVINANPLVSITPSSIPFCPGETGTLTAIPTIPAGVSYVWSNNDTTQSTVVNSSGTYTVTINYSNGCTSDTSISVSLFDAPVALFSTNPNGNTNVYNPITFTSLSTIATGTITSWSWNFGDTTGVYYFGPSQVHSYSVNGTYTITLLICSNNGCCDTVQFPYTIQSDIESPNVFTPNNPGLSQLNNHLYFKNLEYFPGTKLQVFNRWGNKVYENSDYASYQKETYGWDGGKQTDGVYYYVLEGPMLSEPKYGFVQLLR